MSNFKALAEDLDSFLGQLKATQPAQTASSSEQHEQRVPIGLSIDDVVRSAFDLVTAQLKEEDSAESIGEAFMLACSAVAKDAKLDESRVQQHALALLESIVEAARRTL